MELVVCIDCGRAKLTTPVDLGAEVLLIPRRSHLTVVLVAAKIVDQTRFRAKDSVSGERNLTHLPDQI